MPKKPKEAEQVVNFPLSMKKEIRDRLKDLCQRKGRMMNAEIVLAIKNHIIPNLEKLEDV